MRRATLLLTLLAFAGCGDEDSPPPRATVLTESLTFDSEAVGRPLRAAVLRPQAAPRDAPVLVLLHFQGGSPDLMMSRELREGLRRLGERAPVVLLPESDGSSYWHDRESADWGRMVVDEAIPALAREFGLDARRVAIAGVSMGGFGALHLSARYPGRFCSTAAHSPAVFTRRPRGASPFAGAFDDREDFERNGLIARARQIPAGTWVDIGDDDPFAPAVRRMVERMRSPRYREWDGGHDFSYWLARVDEWLRFHVERCS